MLPTRLPPLIVAGCHTVPVDPSGIGDWDDTGLHDVGSLAWSMGSQGVPSSVLSASPSAWDNRYADDRALSPTASSTRVDKAALSSRLHSVSSSQLMPRIGSGTVRSPPSRVASGRARTHLHVQEPVLSD